jgi:hypothetical protein
MLMLVLMNEIFFFFLKKNATQKDRKIERMRLLSRNFSRGRKWVDVIKQLHDYIWMLPLSILKHQSLLEL